MNGGGYFGTQLNIKKKKNKLSCQLIKTQNIFD